ncbi:MjaI family restriction endonuclease [bacterium]|nr:MjaI family restriction endonuclease [bacterium]
MNTSKIKLSTQDIKRYLEIDSPKFPKYVASIINLANQFAQGTRPKVVGQMSELIKEFKGRTLEEWERWYSERKPGAIEAAVQKIWHKVKEIVETAKEIDQDTIKQWVRDLVIVKTFLGLRFQEAILKKVAEIKKTTYRLAEPDEESKGIDGYVGDIAVSIKPETYKSKQFLSEKIEVKIIYYRKIKGGIEVDYSEMM